MGSFFKRTIVRNACLRYNGLVISWENCRDSLVVLFGNGKEETMNTLEVLTLLLVVFAALTYIDNHHRNKK